MLQQDRRNGCVNIILHLQQKISCFYASRHTGYRFCIGTGGPFYWGISGPGTLCSSGSPDPERTPAHLSHNNITDLIMPYLTFFVKRSFLLGWRYRDRRIFAIKRSRTTGAVVSVLYRAQRSLLPGDIGPPNLSVVQDRRILNKLLLISLMVISLI